MRTFFARQDLTVQAGSVTKNTAERKSGVKKIPQNKKRTFLWWNSELESTQMKKWREISAFKCPVGKSPSTHMWNLAWLHRWTRENSIWVNFEFPFQTSATFFTCTKIFGRFLFVYFFSGPLIISHSIFIIHRHLHFRQSIIALHLHWKTPPAWKIWILKRIFYVNGILQGVGSRRWRVMIICWCWCLINIFLKLV